MGMLVVSSRWLCDDGWHEGFGVEGWLVDYDDGWLIEMTAYCGEAIILKLARLEI